MDFREATQSYEQWLGRHTRIVSTDLRLKHRRMMARRGRLAGMARLR